MGRIDEKKQQKKNALLESAYTLFTENGFSRTTISDIAHNAEVAKGTFYLYFDDKESILEELIRQKASRLLIDACNSMDAHMANEGDPMNIADKFIYIIDYLVDHVVNDTALLRLVTKNLTWGMFAHVPAESASQDGTVIDFESYINSMIEADGVRLREPHLLMFTLLDLVSSTCYDSLMYGEPATLEEYKPYLNSCIRLLVNNAVM